MCLCMNSTISCVLYYKITHVEYLLEIFHVLSSSFFTKRVGTRGRPSDNFFIIVRQLKTIYLARNFSNIGDTKAIMIYTLLEYSRP